MQLVIVAMSSLQIDLVELTQYTFKILVILYRS